MNEFTHTLTQGREDLLTECEVVDLQWALKIISTESQETPTWKWWPGIASCRARASISYFGLLSSLYVLTKNVPPVDVPSQYAEGA